MRLKLFATMLCALTLSCMAYAQEYAVSVTYNTNLRASYSLNSQITETVPPGTALQVIGNFNRWLKIRRSSSEMWMADWVPLTRIGAAQTPTDIDNCCFVDRQCTSDHEWTDGYWAYQNNHCAAPTQSSQQTPAQTASSTSPSGDNCCFLDWFCSSDDDWVRGFYAFQSNQCAHGGVSGSGVKIEGSPGFVFQIEHALDLLRNEAPRWHSYVVSGLDLVKQVNHPGSGVHVWKGQFDFNYADDIPSTRTLENHTLRIATILIHEACHVHRYQAGVESGGLEGERACTEIELVALLEFAPNHFLVAEIRHVLANIHRPECQWWHGAYETCYD